MANTKNDTGFESIRIEGGLLSSSLLTHLRLYQLPGQLPEQYDVEKGLKLSDELGRYWRIARARWHQFVELQAREDLDQHTITVEEWLLPLLSRVLGFQLDKSLPVTIGERIFPLTHTACNGAIPFVLTDSTQPIEKGDVLFGGEGRKRSPAGLLQEYLNAEESCLWGIVSNGLTLRLMRDNPAMTRPAYVEIDLARLFNEELYADFTVLWLLLHATRFESQGGSADNCLLEVWRNQGQSDGERVLGELRHGVTHALRIFGTGFITNPANQSLRTAIKDGELSTDQFFQELLRLIYRFLFLFTTEDRNILLDPEADESSKQLYLDGYSTTVLRDRSRFRRHYDKYSDGWQQLCITFDGFATGQAALAQPALGGLFAKDQCPNLEQVQLANRYLYEGLFRLCHFENNRVLTRINYRDLDTEELGSVYESLLELIPQLDVTGEWRFGFLGDGEEEDATTGHARKLTGSYYTPDSLVQELIKSALEPVIKQRLQESPGNPREALLKISVCDPACGSGHFLLAAARRLATELAAIDAGADQPTEADYRHALREVIGHCIYGVDINPLAVELCRTALWLEAFEPGKPLGFLDAHIQIGNSLVGVLDPALLTDGIPDKAYKALSGDDKETIKMLKKRNKLNKKQREIFSVNPPELTACAGDFAEMPEDTLSQVEEKREVWLTMIQGQACQDERLRADLYTAAFFSPKTEENAAHIPTNVELAAHGRGELITSEMSRSVRSIAKEHRFFHWHLAFPDVFENGGFDVLLGNPPWDVSQLSETEYFSSRMPSIATLKGAKRKAAIEELRDTSPLLWQRYQTDKRGIEAGNQFFRVSDRFPLTAVGKLNFYALFAELATSAINTKGTVGVLVPTGIATDDSTKAFFSKITKENSLVGLFSFENRDALFAGVHRSYNFCLLTLGFTSVAAKLTFFATHPAQLKDESRRFSLTPDEFSLINPNTCNCPVFRSQRDAELTKKIYRVAPILIEEAKKKSIEKNPWGIRFSQGLFNMTSFSHLFYTYEELSQASGTIDSDLLFETEEGVYLPLYEAKMVHQYDHRWATYERDGVSSRDSSLEEKRDVTYHNLPRYWVNRREVYLRVSTLPQAFVKALANGDTPIIILGLAHLLFGHYLNQLKEESLEVLAQQLLDHWRDFVAEYPFAEEIAPTQLGFCGNSAPTLFQVESQGFLPGVPVLQLSSSEREVPVWYAIEQHALDLYLQDTAAYNHLIDPIPILIDKESAFAFCEELLERSTPKWLIGWRDICRSTDERTVITGVVPLAGVGHTFPLMFSQESPEKMVVLLANLNSMVLDFIARQKVGGTHLTYGFLKQFPMLSPEQYTKADIAYIVPRVLELTYTSDALKSFANDLGYDGKPFVFDLDRRYQLKCELDAYYARLYKLTREELRYILDPADAMGEDYPTETFRVLKNKEIRDFGEYRTKRLVLEAWDRLEKGKFDDSSLDVPVEEFGSLYPDTATDEAICTAALAIIKIAGPVESMEHFDALILVTHPDVCGVFLDGDNEKKLQAVRQTTSPELFVQPSESIQWKKCRDYLEDRNALSVKHGGKEQIIEAGKQFESVQGSFSYNVDLMVNLALEAVKQMNDLRESRKAASTSQKRAFDFIEEQHQLLQLVV